MAVGAVAAGGGWAGRLACVCCFRGQWVEVGRAIAYVSRGAVAAFAFLAAAMIIAAALIAVAGRGPALTAR